MKFHNFQPINKHIMVETSEVTALVLFWLITFQEAKTIQETHVGSHKDYLVNLALPRRCLTY